MAPSAAATEFSAALSALDIAPRRAARLFNVTSRHIRRWRSGTRNVPHTVGLVVNLLAMGVITVSQAEAAAPASVWTNGGAGSEPSAPVEPEPEQPALVHAEAAAFADLSPAATAILALSPGGCRWPLGGSPQDRNFRFCNGPVSEPPYCAHHRALAYLAPRTAGGRSVRVAYGRRLSISGVFSATGASRAPKILFDRAGDLPDSAPPPA